MTESGVEPKLVSKKLKVHDLNLETYAPFIKKTAFKRDLKCAKMSK